jgi:hypothetical protein
MFDVQLKMFRSADADNCCLLRKSAKTAIDQISTLTSLTSASINCSVNGQVRQSLGRPAKIHVHGKSAFPRGNQAPFLKA